jgi:hypothetical protein
VQEEATRPLEEHAMESLVKIVQRVGPYALVVVTVVMPGGSFVALGLYLYRRYVLTRV